MMSEENGSKKRRRIAQACDECRDRKRRCDGQRPICGPCSRRSSANCIWDEGRHAKGWSNSYVESLRSRIRELEDSQGGDAPDAFSHERLEDHDELPEDLPLAPSIPATSQNHLDLGSIGSDPWQFVDLPERCSVGTRPTNPMGNAANHATDHIMSSPTATQEGVYSPSKAESDDDSEIDAMGVFGSVGGGRRRARDYYGPSSTFTLLSEARRIMIQNNHSSSPRRSSNTLLGFGPDDSASSALRDSLGAPGSQRFGACCDHGPFQLSLPPRDQADALLDSYWTCFHSLYPFVHRPSFNKRYLRLWSPSASAISNANDSQEDYYQSLDDKLFHCILNVVFALGSYFNPAIGEAEREGISSIFFKRAKILINFDMLAQGNIFLVQALLLLAQYLQSTDMSSACWNMAGLAIRVAQGIGLYHDQDNCDQTCSHENKTDQLEVEMRRRVWTGCFLLDRVLSMAYGRPLTIHPTVSQNCILPRAIDDELLSNVSAILDSHPDHTPSLMECYVQSTKLHMILGEVLATFYYHSSAHGHSRLGTTPTPPTATGMTDRLDSGELQRLLDLDSKVVAWQMNLPTHLKLRTYEDRTVGTQGIDSRKAAIFHRQAVVTHARFLHTRLMMFRPVLSFLFHGSGPITGSEQDSSMETAMLRSMLVKGVDLCTSAARDLVDLLTSYLGSTRDVLPPPWYTVYYIHCASIVLLIGRICPQGPFRDEGALVTSWNKCLTFFQSYKSRSRSAKRCYKVLRALQDELFSPQDNGSATALQAYQAGEAVNDSAQQYATAQHGNHAGGLYPDFDMMAYPMFCNRTMNVSDMTWLSSFPFLDPLGDNLD